MVRDFLNCVDIKKTMSLSGFMVLSQTSMKTITRDTSALFILGAFLLIANYLLNRYEKQVDNVLNYVMGHKDNVTGYKDDGSVGQNSI